MRLAPLLFGFVAILLMWGIYGDYSVEIARFFTENPKAGLEVTASWGDSFGGFNAAVSTIGAGLILYTLHLQQVSVKEQFHDLHRQKFESRFFEMLRLLREQRNSLEFSYSSKYFNKKTGSVPNVSKRKVYRSLEAVRHCMAEILYWTRHEPDPENVSRSRAGELYMTGVFTTAETTIATYFRSIYIILNKIKRDKILNDEEKAEYGNLLRGQLTATELYLLAYNSTAPISKDLGNLIEYFHLFKYMPLNRVRIRIGRYFSSRAFQART